MKSGASDGLMENLFGLSAGHRFVFAPGSKEGIERAFISTYLDVVRPFGRTQIVHGGVNATLFKQLEKWGCVSKSLLPGASGYITPEALDEAIRPRTALVSLAWADPMTGVIQPMHDLARVCQEKGVRLHVEASSAIGKLWLNLEDLPFDFLTFGGEGMDAPWAAGGMFVKKDIEIEPFTENLEGAEALLEAAENLVQHQDLLLTETARLKETLERGIIEGFPGASILFQEAQRLPHVFAVNFPKIHAEALRFCLEQRAVRSQRTGEVSVLSFTLAYDVKEEEIQRILDLIVSSALKLKTLSCDLV